jgi:Protein of unknown function (DUF4238)
MTGTSQTKKRHHQIPEFYLKRFAAPVTGQVWNYDKQKGQTWPASVDNTAVESHLYSVTGDDGQQRWPQLVGQYVPFLKWRLAVV